MVVLARYMLHTHTVGCDGCAHQWHGHLAEYRRVSAVRRHRPHLDCTGGRRCRRGLLRGWGLGCCCLACARPAHPTEHTACNSSSATQVPRKLLICFAVHAQHTACVGTLALLSYRQDMDHDAGSNSQAHAACMHGHVLLGMQLWPVKCAQQGSRELPRCSSVTPVRPPLLTGQHCAPVTSLHRAAR